MSSRLLLAWMAFKAGHFGAALMMLRRPRPSPYVRAIEALRRQWEREA